MRAVYLVTQYNDMYNSVENIFVFSGKDKALKFLKGIYDLAEEHGLLEDANLNWKAAPYVSIIDIDNTPFTWSLDIIPKLVDHFNN